MAISLHERREDRLRVRYMVVVARDRTDRLQFWASQFAGESNVEVVLDRRRGERRAARADGAEAERRRRERRGVPRWDEDLRFHPVVLIQRPAEPADGRRSERGVPARRQPREAFAPGAREAVAPERCEICASGDPRLERWLADGRAVLDEVLPNVLGEHALLRAAGRLLDREVARLRGQRQTLRVEVAALRAERERLLASRAGLASAAARAHAGLAGVVDLARRLAERLHGAAA
jgi:hypothetical protein